MTTVPRRRPAAAAGRSSTVLLRLVVAVAFAVSAFVHVDLAQGPWVAAGEVTLAGLFVADAVAAVLAGAWVLVRPSRTAWAVAVLVGVASLLALLVTTWVKVPGPGPLPTVYDPFWYTDKAVAAVAAGLAAAGAAVGLAGTARRRSH